MTTQYDSIAKNYQKIKEMTIYQVLAHTFLFYVGDVKGKSVLDLACGDGFFTRQLKQRGASRVVGVDISAEQLKLAKSHENTNPLGIEYIQSAVQALDKLGEFDLVVAGFLLNYAPTKAELLKMCQIVYANLKSGQRFVTLNNNAGKTIEFPPDAFAKYDVEEVPLAYPVKEGDIIRITTGPTEAKVQFDIYYYSRQTYTQALQQAGFSTVTWHNLILPLAYELERPFWDFLLQNPLSIVIECQKP